VAVWLLESLLNWRSNLSNLPSAATAGERRVGCSDSVLAGAGVQVVVAAHLTFPWLLLQRAFLVRGFHNGFSGDHDCAMRLAKQ
jgi:hypothetical protein